MLDDWGVSSHQASESKTAALFWVQEGPKGGDQVLELELRLYHDSDQTQPKLLS